MAPDVMKPYTGIIIALLAGELAPVAALAVLLRPRPVRYFLRGGEAAICLAVAIDSCRRLLLIALGARSPYPGFWTALLNISLLSFVALLMWMRLVQHLRHQARNKAHVQLGIAQLRASGVSEEEIQQVIKPKGNK